MQHIFVNTCGLLAKFNVNSSQLQIRAGCRTCMRFHRQSRGEARQCSIERLSSGPETLVKLLALQFAVDKPIRRDNDLFFFWTVLTTMAPSIRRACRVFRCQRIVFSCPLTWQIDLWCARGMPREEWFDWVRSLLRRSLESKIETVPCDSCWTSRIFCGLDFHEITTPTLLVTTSQSSVLGCVAKG